MSTDTAPGPRRSDDEGRRPAQRMVVTWQHPELRRINPVGLLEFDGSLYHFRYLRVAATIEGFRPFLGFPKLAEHYQSSELFPLFFQRVMDPRRPDYSRFVEALDLSKDATPWEQLARTEGRRTGDTVQVFPEPAVRADGYTACRFLVHGIRHCLKDPDEREDVLGQLRRGEELALTDEPTNEVNPRAILTSTLTGRHLGWVPDLLLDYVHAVRAHGSINISVARVNGPDAPGHLRLLVSFEGWSTPGYKPFSGPQWEPIADLQHKEIRTDLLI